MIFKVWVFVRKEKKGFEGLSFPLLPQAIIYYEIVKTRAQNNPTEKSTSQFVLSWSMGFTIQTSFMYHLCLWDIAQMILQHKSEDYNILNSLNQTHRRDAT